MMTSYTNGIQNNTTILKSVENTYYYNDDLSDINNVKYTLFGNSGDQDENELRFNEPLLNRNKTKHIYLYHVKNSSKNKEWIWYGYGKYDIDKKETKRYIGKDNQMRNIIILSLKKIH